jgi:hypothetical protein
LSASEEKVGDLWINQNTQSFPFPVRLELQDWLYITITIVYVFFPCITLVIAKEATLFFVHVWVYFVVILCFLTTSFSMILVHSLVSHGHQVEEKHYLPSLNGWPNKFPTYPTYAYK